MKIKIFLSLLGLIIILAILKLLMVFSSSPNEYSEDDYRNMARKNYKIFNVYMPETVVFATETIPTNLYYVRESLDRELLVNTYWHSSSFLLFKRAYRWFPIIEPILKKNNIPADFKYLAVIESNLTNAVSPAGAAGFWQFMKTTATSFGLEVNAEVDERYNIYKSTAAACKYLSQAYRKYGSWITATASYNAGYGTIDKALQSQNCDNYFDLLLNEETSRYLYRIVAVKLIMENPTEYGFHLRKKDLYPPVPLRKIEISESIPDLAAFAIDQGFNYRVLKDFNPWLRKNSLTNTSKKTYEIYLPISQEALKYDFLQKEIINDNMLIDKSFFIEEI